MNTTSTAKPPSDAIAPPLSLLPPLDGAFCAMVTPPSRSGHARTISVRTRAYPSRSRDRAGLDEPVHVARELLDGTPVGVFVVVRHVGVATFAFRDGAHHTTFDPAVLRVDERAGEQPDEVGIEAGALEQLLH